VHHRCAHVASTVDGRNGAAARAPDRASAHAPAHDHDHDHDHAPDRASAHAHDRDRVSAHARVWREILAWFIAARI
jgi:hypothetical protein